jgi:hypothetical protein
MSAHSASPNPSAPTSDRKRKIIRNILLRIPGHQRQVQQQRQPISIDKEQNREESVEAGFRDDVHVEAVAQIDRVDVVAFEVRVHDGEEDLQEEVDGIEEDGEEE